MAIDTAEKRAAVAGLPFLPLGVNVTPGSFATTLGRSAAAWSYLTSEPPPVVGGAKRDLYTLGSITSLHVGVDGALGGRGSW